MRRSRAMFQMAVAAVVLATMMPSPANAVDVAVHGQTLLLDGKPLRGFHAVYQSTPNSQAISVPEPTAAGGLIISAGGATIARRHRCARQLIERKRSPH